MSDLLLALLNLSNETLSTAIVVVAASLLLYNLSRNATDRVARTSAVVLACVTIVYTGDVLLSLEPDLDVFEGLLRIQWIGLAYIPAAMFHLSDALLATTGLPSRGRRRRVIRILYAIGAVFLLIAALTDTLIRPMPLAQRVELDPGPVFPVYLLYFTIANGVAFINVNRARRRCLTRSTQRRMAYLQIAMLTPLIGIFPYSMFLDVGDTLSLRSLLLLNIANFVVVLMLLFLSYPLSFFGSRVPDRVVKRDLLRFVLRGPATALLALVVILFSNPISTFLGLPSNVLMPFGTVTVILLWQWGTDLSLPWLEQNLIYTDNEDNSMATLQQIGERALSHSDLTQLLDAILEATCDYLRVNVAFILSLNGPQPDIVRSIGALQLPENGLAQELAPIVADFNNTAISNWTIYTWSGFWVLPLFGKRRAPEGGQRPLIGMMGIEARSEQPDLSEDDMTMLRKWVVRAAQTLDDTMLLTEIYAAVEGLLPQMTMNRERAAEVEYRPGRTIVPITDPALPDRHEVIEQVRAALRHFWGGPGLSHSRLLELNIVQQELADGETTPTQALQRVLRRVVDMQRPQDDGNTRSPEWTLYNILNKRFIESRKARDTARALYISEANLFRKQNVAIEAVADTLLKLERESNHNGSAP